MIPTTTDALNTLFWTSLVGGIAVAFGIFAAVLNAIEDRIQKALSEDIPFVDDVTERRRVKANAFAARRKQLDAAMGKRA